MLKENQFVAISLHDIRSLNVTKGEKLFVDFRNGRVRVDRLEGQTKNVVFRLTDNLESQKQHPVHARHGEYAIVIPDGARLKQADFQIEQDDFDMKVSAIAQVKEMYLKKCACIGKFEPAPEFSIGMSLFTSFCDSADAETAKQAYNLFKSLL